MIVLRIGNLSPLPATGFKYTYTILEEEYGENGLELCSLVKPDAILLDFCPDIDGLEFLDELKNQIGRTSLPVIMLTGQGEAIAVQAMKSGARLFSQGNMTPQILRLAIHNVVERAHLLWQLERTKSDFFPLKICWIVLAYTRAFATSLAGLLNRVCQRRGLHQQRHDSVRTDWQAAARIVAV